MSGRLIPFGSRLLFCFPITFTLFWNFPMETLTIQLDAFDQVSIHSPLA